MRLDEPDVPSVDNGRVAPLALPASGKAAVGRRREHRMSTPQLSQPLETPPARKSTVRTVRVQPPKSNAGAGKDAISIRIKNLESELQNRLQHRLGAFRKLARALDQAADELAEGPAKAYAGEFLREFLGTMETKLIEGDGQTPKNQSNPTNTQRPRPGANTTTNRQATKTYADALATNNVPSGQSQTQGPTLGTTNSKQPRTKEDLRVLVRLDEESPAWNKTGYAVRELVRSTLAIKPVDITGAKRTATGWSLTTRNIITRDLIINRKNEYLSLLGGIEASKVVRWCTYIVHDCPPTVYDYNGTIRKDTKAAYFDEVLAQTGQTPVDIRPTRKSHDSESDKKDFLISFEKPTERTWRLFGASRLARLIQKKTPLSQRGRCWDFHSEATCEKTQRCRRCGGIDHDGTECRAADPRCVNCLAVHEADYEQCLARPRRENGVWRKLTKAEKGAARQAGAGQSASHKSRKAAGRDPAPGTQAPLPPPRPTAPHAPALANIDLPASSAASTPVRPRAPRPGPDSANPTNQEQDLTAASTTRKANRTTQVLGSRQ